MKVYVIQWNDFVSYALEKFFLMNEGYIEKNDDQYIFARQYTRDFMRRFLSVAFLEFCNKYVPVSPLSLYVVVNDGYPYLNWRKDVYFDKLSEEAQQHIKISLNIKFVLRENDISIDELYLNNVFEDFFNEYFTDRDLVIAATGRRNMLFFKNLATSSYDLILAVKRLFGNANVEVINYDKTHVLSMNDIVYDKYARNSKGIPKPLRDNIDSFINVLGSYVFKSIHGLDEGDNE